MPERGDRAPAGSRNAVDNSQLTSMVQAVTMTQFTAGLPGAQAAPVPVTRSSDGTPYTAGEIAENMRAGNATDSSSNLPSYARAAGFAVAVVAVIIIAVRTKNWAAARAAAGQTGQNVAQGLAGKASPIGTLFTANQLSKFQGQLAQHGIKSLLKSQMTIRTRLDQHIQKLEQIRQSGGHASSVEREIRNFQQELNAIEEVLRTRQ